MLLFSFITSQLFWKARPSFPVFSTLANKEHCYLAFIHFFPSRQMVLSAPREPMFFLCFLIGWFFIPQCNCGLLLTTAGSGVSSPVLHYAFDYASACELFQLQAKLSQTLCFIEDRWLYFKFDVRSVHDVPAGWPKRVKGKTILTSLRNVSFHCKEFWSLFPCSFVSYLKERKHCGWLNGLSKSVFLVSRLFSSFGGF